jgi:hypothetical protein
MLTSKNIDAGNGGGGNVIVIENLQYQLVYGLQTQMLG